VFKGPILGLKDLSNFKIRIVVLFFGGGFLLWWDV
jgi:hypothetical protein